MRSLCVVAFIYLLLISSALPTAAQEGDCYERKPAIASIHMQGYVPIAELEALGRPAILFVNGRNHKYLILTYHHKEDMVCKVAEGEAFYLIKWRKA